MSDHLLVATAGHVDHGKSTLVRNLTGTDPDRWAEEKARGITIDLGYAALKAPKRTYSFVDVPGHERFIHNMLAGVGSLDAALLVIAADESIMPQSREHARALHFLGVDQVALIVTKTDLVEPDFLSLVHEELDEWLTPMGWHTAPRACVSSKLPQTLGDVLKILENFVPKRRDPNRFFRLPIDRVFTSMGSGTVITGTIANGSLDKSETVTCVPQLRTSRVRQIQVHEEPTNHARQHQRAALNLSDLHHSEIARGNFLVANVTPAPSSKILVRLSRFQDWEPSRKHRFHCHYFTAHFMASLVWHAEDMALLHLEEPHCFWALDRGLIRDGSPLQVVSGFEILHPNPSSSRKKFYLSKLERLQSIASPKDWIKTLPKLFPSIWKVQTMESLTGVPFAKSSELDFHFLDQEQFLAMEVYEQFLEMGLQVLMDLHCENTFFSTLPLAWVRSGWTEADIPQAIQDQLLGELQKRNLIQLSEDRLKASQHQPSWSSQALSALKLLLAGLQAELPILDLRNLAKNKLQDSIIQMLVWEKFLTPLSPDLLISSNYLNHILPQMATAFYGTTFQVGDLKDKLNITRKLAIPLLEWLDKNGYTLREAGGRRWLSENPGGVSTSWLPPWH